MGKLDFKVKRLAVMKNEYFMVKTLRRRVSVGVHGTGTILIYEALGAKWALMPSTLHQLLIHEVLTILVEVSFQKASIIKLIYTKKAKHVAMTYGSILINL